MPTLRRSLVRGPMRAPREHEMRREMYRCTARLADWFPGRLPTDLSVIRSVVAKRTGRPILRVIGEPLPGLPTAIWWRAETADVILLHPNTTQLTRILGEAHELGHIICGHTPQPLSRDREHLLAAHPNIHPGLAHGVLRRCAPDTVELSPVEREAELTARLLVAPLLIGDPDIHLHHRAACPASASSCRVKA